MVRKDSMSKHAFRFTLAAMLLFSSNVFADWQYTRWGMTVEQVKEASKGSAVAVADPKPRLTDVARLMIPYFSESFSRESFRFVVFFYFTLDTDRLTAVDLKLHYRRDCRHLIETLKIRYGTPASISRDKYELTWRDNQDGNTVVATYVPGIAGVGPFCSVLYTPFDKESSKGL